MSLRAQRDNLPPWGLRLLRRCAPRNDIRRFEIVSKRWRRSIDPSLNFEFWTFEFVWDLGFGVWNFRLRVASDLKGEQPAVTVSRSAPRAATPAWSPPPARRP